MKSIITFLALILRLVNMLNIPDGGPRSYLIEGYPKRKDVRFE